MSMTQREMFEASFQRPKNFLELSMEERWAIDKKLGILDWNSSDLSHEDVKRIYDHYGTKYNIAMIKQVKEVLNEYLDP